MPRRRVNFARIHARNDALAWAAIHSRPAPTHDQFGLRYSGRPANFEELAEAVHQRGQEFDFALSHFLDEFYLFRRPSFFQKEPPASFGPKDRAFLAATAEFLCHEFGFEPPAWASREEYRLPAEWDYITDIPEFPEALRSRVAARRERATPEFLRHGIIFESRGLLRL